MPTPTDDFKAAWMGIKGLESELRAYERAFAAFKIALPQYAQLLDDSLVAARLSPALQEMMRKKYDEVLGKFLQPGVEVLSQEEVLTLLHMPLKSTKIN